MPSPHADRERIYSYGAGGLHEDTLVGSNRLPTSGFAFPLVPDLLLRAKHLFVAAMLAAARSTPRQGAGSVNTCSRAATPRSPAASLPSDRTSSGPSTVRSEPLSLLSKLLMKTLLNSCMIRGSTLWAFRGRNNKISAAAARSAIAVNTNSCRIAFSRLSARTARRQRAVRPAARTPQRGLANLAAPGRRTRNCAALPSPLLCSFRPRVGLVGSRQIFVRCRHLHDDHKPALDQPPPVLGRASRLV